MPQAKPQVRWLVAGAVCPASAQGLATPKPRFSTRCANTALETAAGGERVLSRRPEHPNMLELLSLDAIRRAEFGAASAFLERALRQPLDASRRTWRNASHRGRQGWALALSRLAETVGATQCAVECIGCCSARSRRSRTDEIVREVGTAALVGGQRDGHGGTIEERELLRAQ